jgi:SulP family sulfate permease
MVWALLGGGLNQDFSDRKVQMMGLKVPRKTLLNDAVTGLVMAVINVPQALANGVLAGVNPVFGLYSMIVGTTVAAFVTASVFMNVDSTSATALTAGEALAGVTSEEHLGYLVVLGLLVGLFMLVFGLLKLGFLVRFVSNAVMTGFLSGLGVLTVLGQVGDLTNYYSEAGNKVFRAIDTFLHFGQIDLPTLFIGLATIVTIVLVERTPLKRYAYLVALALVTILVPLLGLESVTLVGDTTNIPRTIPIPHLPQLSLVPSLILPALAIALIALVQAAGVSQSVPNPDGEYPDPSGDFRGQGIANIAVGLSGGIPVGGSVSGTALVRSSGAQSRWANIFTGLFGLVVVLLFAPVVELIPLAALAGLLVTVGAGMVNVPRLRTVWNTGAAPLTIMLITFVATLFTPIQVAVALGVMLHILLYIFRSAEAVRLERIVPQEDGTFVEGDVPKALPSGEIVVLQPIGSLFFAGVAELEEHLPKVGQAQEAVVIIRLRDRDEVGSTFIRTIERYLKSLQTGGNVLMLEGLSEKVLDQLRRTDLLNLIGEENVFLGQPQHGASLRQALAAAEEWLARDQGNREETS